MRTKIYLLPILGLFAIFIAAIINSVFSKHIILKIGKIILVILLVKVVSANFYLLYSKPIPFENLHSIYSARDAIAGEVLKIQKEENFKETDFFQIRSFNNKPQTFQAFRNSILWVLLEKKWDKKLTTIPEGGTTYVDINSADYIFISCYYRRGSHDTRKCRELFLELNPEYEIVKDIFRGKILSVYEAKKLTR